MKMVRIVLSRGKCYEGRDYSAGEVVEVTENWARRWIMSDAAALYIEEPPLSPPPTLTSLSQVEVLQERDPRPAGRRKGRK